MDWKKRSMINEPNEVPVLHLVYEEINDYSRLWVYDSDKVLVGQIYTKEVRYEKPVRELGTIWVGFPASGENIIEGMDFTF